MDPDPIIMLFQSVEDVFTNEFMRIYKIHPEEIQERMKHMNLCCAIEIRGKMIEYAKEIHTVFPGLSYMDIFGVLIYAFYGLGLNEEFMMNFMKLKFLENRLNNKPLGMQLYFGITIGDMYSSNGDNLSSKIRRTLLGMDLNSMDVDDPPLNPTGVDILVRHNFMDIGGKSKRKRKNKKIIRKSKKHYLTCKK